MNRPLDLRERVDEALKSAEGTIYALACLVLGAGAVALLVKSAYDLATGLDDGVTEVATAMLDTLLLAFILVELLGAVRVTINERRLVAEPFLLVGVIATIKELVVRTVEAGDLTGSEEFDDTMVELGVLGGLLLILAVSSYLLRRKEREPAEVDE